jgi:hypothetical protein
MAFEKREQLNFYHELSDNTKYRFAEIEMSQAIRQLSNLYKYEGNMYQKAARVIYRAITPPYTPAGNFEEDFISSVMSPQFMTPNKKEKIHYLIMKEHTYKTIREHTGASPNTISRMTIGLPEYYPVFQHWTPELLDQWNIIKTVVNAFNQPLLHT